MHFGSINFSWILNRVLKLKVAIWVFNLLLVLTWVLKLKSGHLGAQSTCARLRASLVELLFLILELQLLILGWTDFGWIKVGSR